MQTLSGSALGDESKIRGDGHPSYQSLSLKEAWRRVEDNNPDYIAAQAKVRDAEGDLIVAGQRPNPALSLGTAWYRAPDGSGGASLMDRLQKYTDYNVGISISVERGSKRELREGEAAKGLEASRADLDTLVTDLKLQLVQIYFDLAAAERKEVLSREYADSYSKSVAAMQLRFKSGDVSAVDLSRTELEAEQAEIQASASSSERREIQTALAKILGTNDAEGLHTIAPWSWDAPPIGEPAKAVDVEKLTEVRADVVAANARLEQARRAIKLAESLRKGDVTLSAIYDHEPPGNSLSQDNVSFNVSIPLQVRYQYRGEISKAYAELDMAEANLTAVRNEAANEIQKSRDTLAMKSTQIKHLYAGVVPRAQETVRATEFAYQHGASSLTDLLDARRALQSLLLDVTAARADCAKASAMWHILTGDESPISKQ